MAACARLPSYLIFYFIIFLFIFICLFLHPPVSPSRQFNLTHDVKRLSFGTDYPGLVNPLDGHVEVAPAESGSSMYQYFVKVRRAGGYGLAGGGLTSGE